MSSLKTEENSSFSTSWRCWLFQLCCHKTGPSLPSPSHLLLISLWPCSFLPSASWLSDGQPVSSAPCCITCFDQCSTRFLSVSKFLPFLGHNICKSRNWRFNNTQYSYLSELALKAPLSPFWAHLSVLWKKLSAVALDVPSIIPQEHPVTASLCVQVPEKSRSSFYDLGRNTSAEDWLLMAALNKSAALVYMKTCLYCYLPLSSLSLPSFFPHMLHVVIDVGQKHPLSCMLLQHLAPWSPNFTENSGHHQEFLGKCKPVGLGSRDMFWGFAPAGINESLEICTCVMIISNLYYFFF